MYQFSLKFFVPLIVIVIIYIKTDVEMLDVPYIIDLF